MQDFDYQLRPRIVFGANSIGRLGKLAKELGANRVLLVSDPGVLAAGIYEKGRESLQSEGLEVVGYHDFAENPNTKHVDRGVAYARETQPDFIVGLGGGSSMDCAKGINFVYSCGGTMHDYWGVGKATKEMLPMIAVPTTSGTGSETQSFALISDSDTHVKMACGDPKAACRVAVLDPLLTVSQPPGVTALTGMDAITHALETFVCKKSTPISECYSLEAWQRLTSGFPGVLSEPDNIACRSEMQLGACFAGMAIEASMLGGAHALANPITAFLGTPHGQAVGMMMPHIVRFNATSVGDRYARLMRMVDPLNPPSSDPSGALFALLQGLLRESGLCTSLRQLAGWPTSDHDEKTFILKMAELAAKQWTGAFNPRPLSVSDFVDLYLAAL